MDAQPTTTKRLDDFRALMERVQQGSKEAIEQFLDEYGPYIHRAVRRRLNKRLRTKFDSDDFVQAVWLSFFEQRPALSRFAAPEPLIAYLIRMARNKIADECRRRLANGSHNANRETSMDGSAAWSKDVAYAGDATPSEVVSAKEQWDRLIEGQPSRYAQMLNRRAAGHTFAEIAKELGVHERTVRRVFERFARRMSAG